MNMNQIPIQLPENYISIGEGCAVHLSAIERFTEDVAAFFEYIDITNEYPPVGDPEAMKEVTIRSSASTLEVAARQQEHGNLIHAVAQLLEGGYWPEDEPQPLFLRST